VKPEDRADPKSIYHVMTVTEVQDLFGSGNVVCTLECFILEISLLCSIVRNFQQISRRICNLDMHSRRPVSKW